MLSIACELAGVACLAVFVFFVWPPLVFLVVAVWLLITAVGLDGGQEVSESDDS